MKKRALWRFGNENQSSPSILTFSSIQWTEAGPDSTVQLTGAFQTAGQWTARSHHTPRDLFSAHAWGHPLWICPDQLTSPGLCCSI
ncbi:hypothetical protein [Paenibacillus amylolyticus]|uniref:hypothetical protein n=1 Tax=Paenibacillus amylolyticus TaxID=1451 RepID=UPI003EBC18BF